MHLQGFFFKHKFKRMKREEQESNSIAVSHFVLSRFWWQVGHFQRPTVLSFVCRVLSNISVRQ